MTKIVIADDEAPIRVLTEAIFKSLDMDVTLAVDGADAIEKISRIVPDLVITDVVMPNQNGFEVCKHIRNTPELSHIPVILLSAMGDDYNKITGFEGGADDYVTKPFNIEELKARVKALLFRYQRLQTPKDITPQPLESGIISSGLAVLDQSLSGGFPKGSNILVLGSIGSGKSSFGRDFISQGLAQSERALVVAMDDSPTLIHQHLGQHLRPHHLQFLQIVDAYSWASMTELVTDNPFSVQGMLDLNQLSGIIADASMALGQSVQVKAGGRRVIDSISSLLIHFELSAVQRFITQIARTAVAFGNVTTLFIIEDGTVDSQTLNHIKYVMDGVVEFGTQDGHRAVRVQSMKWTRYSPQWQIIA